LLHFVAVLDLVDENLGGLEAGHIVLVDYQGCVARDVSGNFLLSLFIDEAAKTADVNVLSVGHVGFDNTEECFYRCRHIGFINSGLFCDFVNYISFGHDRIFKSKNFGDGKFNLWLQN
jgi:hypothetical protein